MILHRVAGDENEDTIFLKNFQSSKRVETSENFFSLIKSIRFDPQDWIVLFFIELWITEFKETMRIQEIFCNLISRDSRRKDFSKVS